MRTLAASSLVLLVLACSTPPADVPDAGTDAAEPIDTGPVDASTNDVGNDVGPFDANTPVETVIYVTDADVALFQAFAFDLPAELAAGVRSSADPAAEVAAPGAGTTRIAVVLDGAIASEGYRLEQASDGFVVHGGGVLGEQYGVAALLEAMGVRFFHPDESFVPATLAAPDAALFGPVVVPEMAERGVMPWTLHPIEAFIALWEPSGAHLREAERIVDWCVKNRANFLAYAALDNIARLPADQAAWEAHTQAIVSYAHLRGIRVGIGLQLFGGASLQRALTLVPSGVPDEAASIEARLGFVSDVPFDAIQLSFGEFSGEDPQHFIDTLNLADTTIQRVMPGTDVAALVHVGNFPSTHVTYMGNDLLYYFLVQYAQPHVVPWIHTTMFFDLFEPTSGAYGHTEFDQHREYLFDRLAAHQPVTYEPENAYWITFDDSVPLYLPLYVRSRHLDLARIRERATTDGDSQLDSHVIFTSGWEWGYWQHDWAVMHMTHTLPATSADLYHQMLDPVPGGPAVADVVNDLVEIEHRALIDDELSAYTAGTDASFQLGLDMGVWSEPRRPTFAEIQAMSATERAAFRTDVLTPLAAFQADLVAIEGRLAALSIDPDDRWLGEIVDGVHATRLRVDFAVALWTAAADFGDGTDVDAVFPRLMAIEADVASVAAHRLAHFHAPNGDELVAESRRSVLIYNYGYLRHANDQCFYRRERIELDNLVHGASAMVPNCLL